ncbi:hypothetical protein E2542_SST00915 [Spatholobus suberectus]|nr:hypothetical protein E2542_SST00915 [Spatholobus suberectus]
MDLIASHRDPFLIIPFPNGLIRKQPTNSVPRRGTITCTVLSCLQRVPKPSFQHTGGSVRIQQQLQFRAFLNKTVSEKLLHRPPLIGIPLQTLPQKVPPLLRHETRNLRHLAGEPDPVNHRRRVAAAVPRWLPGDHLQHRAPQSPHVGSEPLLLPTRHLRRHERRRAGDRRRGLPHPPRATQVSDFHPLLRHQHVLSLHVAMHYSIRVEVVQTLQNLARVGPHHRFFHTTTALRHRPVRRVLHEQVEPVDTVLESDVTTLVCHNLRTLQCGKNHLLPFEEFRPVELRRLDGEHLTGPARLGNVDGGGGAPAEGVAPSPLHGDYVKYFERLVLTFSQIL